MTSAIPTPADETTSRLERWEQRTAAPLFLLAVIFFVCSVLLIASDVRDDTFVALAVIAAVIWLVFAVEFTVRLLMAHDRRHFLAHRWFDLASVIIPLLRPFLIIVFVWRMPVFERSAAAMRTRYIVTMLIFVVLFVYTAASFVWLAERTAPDASIVNLGDAIWWGFTTITTVGYGDFTPVTVAGRTLAVFLMIGGVVVLGVTSATILSVLGEQLKRVADAAEASRREREAAGTLPVPRRPLARVQADTFGAGVLVAGLRPTRVRCRPFGA